MSAVQEGEDEDDELFQKIDRAVSAYTRTPVAHRRRRAYGDIRHAGREAREPAAADVAAGDHAPATSDGHPASNESGSFKAGTSACVPRKRTAHGELHEPRRAAGRPTSRRQCTKPRVPRQGRESYTGDAHTNAEVATIREHRARTRALAHKIAMRHGRSAEGLQAAADLLRTKSAQDELDELDASESSPKTAKQRRMQSHKKSPSASSSVLAPALDPVVRVMQPGEDCGHGSPHTRESPKDSHTTTRVEEASSEIVMCASTDAEDNGGGSARTTEGIPASAHASTYERVLSKSQSSTLSSVLQHQARPDQTRVAEQVSGKEPGAGDSGQQICATERACVPGSLESHARQTIRGVSVIPADREELRNLMEEARGIEEQLARRLKILVDKERKVSQRSGKLAARADALSAKEAKAEDRETELKEREAVLSKRECAADFARRRSQLAAQETRIEARLAEANQRVLQAEKAESAAFAAQAELDRREADLNAAKSATDRRDAMLSEASAATEVRKQIVTESTLRLTSDAERLREQQESLNVLSMRLASQSTALAAREAALKTAESNAVATARGAEARMGEVNLWKMEREEEVATTRVELETRARALDEKEQGLLFLEVQLEETSVELERREVALGMSETEAADKFAQLNRLEQTLVRRLKAVEAREAAVAQKEKTAQANRRLRISVGSTHHA